MSKLKQLSQDDLSKISDDFGEILEKEISKALPSKEIEDLDLDIVLTYENPQLDVDVDVGVVFDELSEITQDQIMSAIDEAYLKFDSYIDDHYRIQIIFFKMWVLLFFIFLSCLVIIFYKKVFIL